MKKFLGLFCLFFALPESTALHWNRQVKESGSTIYTCLDDDVQFPYSFNLAESEIVESLTWTHIGNDVTEAIALLYSGEYMITNRYFNKIVLGKNGNFTMKKAGVEDVGRYNLEIKTRGVDQTEQTFTKDVELVVSNSSMYKGNKLHARLSDLADYDSDTESFLLSLTCGNFIFKNDNAPPIDVEWITPDGSVKSSTKYSDGKFYLQLDNPVEEGQYLCKIPDKALDQVCAASSNKDRSTQATVNINDMKIRVVQLENENRHMKQLVKEKETQFRNELSALEAYSRNSCEDWYGTASGTQKIYLTLTNHETIFCDQVTEGGRWNVFQRRQDGSVDFHRGWADYRQGFGEPEEEFWLGLETLHKMTSEGRKYELRIDIVDHNGREYFAVYDDFSIGSESEEYPLRFSGFKRGDAHDDLVTHKNMKFTTFDRENDIWDDGNCAVTYSGGWWYTKCHKTNLNGLYNSTEFAKGLFWFHITGHHTSLTKSEMKFRLVQ